MFDRASELWHQNRGDGPMRDQIRILIIDDEPDMRRILRRCFEQAGYDVSEAQNGDEAWQMLAARVYNLVTVDVNLYAADGHGREDGKALARDIRQRHDCGIIMVSVINDMEERNSWLEVWADDTITKPFVVEELLARTRAVLRRYGHVNAREGGQSGDVATFAGWTLDLKRHELRSPGDGPVALTMGDFNLLRNLLKHPHEVLSRDQIVEMDSSIQSMSSTDSARAVDMRISRLRDKLGDDTGDEKKLIKTVRGAGYMFVADVNWKGRDPDAASGPDSDSEPPGSANPGGSRSGGGDGGQQASHRVP
jgi:two-component system, OmpR family, response regulator